MAVIILSVIYIVALCWITRSYGKENLVGFLRVTKQHGPLDLMWADLVKVLSKLKIARRKDTGLSEHSDLQSEAM